MGPQHGRDPRRPGKAALEERFRDWVWEDPDRTARLAAATTGCSTPSSSLLRRRRRLPGLAASFAPRPHQVDRRARIVRTERAVGLATRSAPARPPRWSWRAWSCAGSAWSTSPPSWSPTTCWSSSPASCSACTPRPGCWWPARRPPPPTPHTSSPAAATGDWDAVIMTHSAFERIPVSAEAQRAYLIDEVDRSWAGHRRHQGKRGADRQAAGGALVRAEERQERNWTPPRTTASASSKPASTTCSSTRPTAFKNLGITTHIDGGSPGRSEPRPGHEVCTCRPQRTGRVARSPPPRRSPTPSPRCTSRSATCSPTRSRPPGWTASTPGPPPSARPSTAGVGPRRRQLATG